MAEMDNANPVVLSATDLPTRRGRNAATSKTNESGLIAAIEAFPSYAADPFSHYAEESSSDSEVDEDEESDPVDAQEIYGRFRTFFHTSSKCRHFQIFCLRTDVPKAVYQTPKNTTFYFRASNLACRPDLPVTLAHIQKPILINRRSYFNHF